MLLSGAKCEHKSTLAIGVNRLATDASGHLTNQFMTCRKKTHMRPAKIKANADALAFANDNVRTLLAGRGNRGQRDGLCKDGDQERAFRVSGLRDRSQVDNLAVNIGGLHHDAGRVVVNLVDDTHVRPKDGTICGDVYVLS